MYYYRYIIILLGKQWSRTERADSTRPREEAAMDAVSLHRGEMRGWGRQKAVTPCTSRGV